MCLVLFLFNEVKMAKTAIQLIREGFAYAGIAPTGTPLNADMSREGLNFLNELLYKWNIENYFPFTNNTLDAHVTGGRATIYPDEEATFNGERPLNVNKVLYKDGNEWYPLVRVSYDNIWERRVQTSKPYCFAFSNDEDGNGIITFDCENGNFDARVIYNRALPEMDYNDELAAPSQYEQLLKYGIAVKCCIRYGLPPDTKAYIEEEQESILNAIKKQNSFKHKIDLSPRLKSAYDDYSLLCQYGRRM